MCTCYIQMLLYILALYKMLQYQGLGELGLTWIFWWWQLASWLSSKDQCRFVSGRVGDGFLLMGFGGFVEIYKWLDFATVAN